jgi:hypothetical protein
MYLDSLYTHDPMFTRRPQLLEASRLVLDIIRYDPNTLLPDEYDKFVKIFHAAEDAANREFANHFPNFDKE